MIFSNRNLLVFTIIFVCVGFLVMMSGLIYDLSFAGIPYQDPTPELAASYEANKQVANNLFLIGGGLSSLGALAAVALAIKTIFSLTKQEEHVPQE